MEAPVLRLTPNGGAAVAEAVADVGAPNADGPGVAVNENNGLSLTPSLIPLSELAAPCAEKVNSSGFPLASSFLPSSPAARFLLFSSIGGVEVSGIGTDVGFEEVDVGAEPKTKEKPGLSFCPLSLDFAFATSMLALFSPIAAGGIERGAEVGVETAPVDAEAGAGAGAAEEKKSGTPFAFASTSFSFSFSFAG